ncbi:hypothetical protein [Glutamicibacter uratoxydans]|nr:hypothetical protein [Glutamicibacter uratoxydans]
MWSIVLLTVGAFLAGGAISLKNQNAHISWIIVAWGLAIGCAIAAWALTY